MGQLEQDFDTGGIAGDDGDVVLATGEEEIPLQVEALQGERAALAGLDSAYRAEGGSDGGDGQLFDDRLEVGAGEGCDDPMDDDDQGFGQGQGEG